MRSEEESLLELLMLGVHWLSYGDDAHDLPATKRTVLTALADIRREEPAMKPAADRLRGILATLWIVPQGRDWHPDASLDHLDRLLGWLSAAGDYREEVANLEAWCGFFATIPP